MSRPAAIKPLSKVKAKCRIIVYGQPGTKKSILAASSPNVLILANNEEEMIAPANMGAKADVWVMDDWDDMMEAKEWLRHEKDQGGYDWVWMDNVTLFEGQGMHQIMEELVAKASHRSLYIPDMAEYQKNMRMMEEWVRDMCSIPINFGMTAHVMRIFNPITEEMQMIPMIGTKKGDNSEKIAGMMNVVAHVKSRPKKDDEKVTEIVMRVQGTEEIMAKDRYGAIGGTSGIMINPTIPRIMEKIEAQTTRPAGAAKKTPTKRAAKRPSPRREVL